MKKIVVVGVFLALFLTVNTFGQNNSDFVIRGKEDKLW